MKKCGQEIGSIVIRTPNWLGDAVMCLPALAAVRRHFAGATITLIVQPAFADLFAGLGDRFLCYRPGGKKEGVLGRFGLIRSIRALSPDIGILFTNSFESALLFRLAGVSRLLGYSRYGRGFMLSDGTPFDSEAASLHLSRYYVKMLEPLDIEDADPWHAPAVELDALEKARGTLRDLELEERSFCVLAPKTAYGPAKEWPAQRFVRLADLLADKHNLSSVLVGTADDASRAEEIVKLARSAPVNLAGRTSLAELAALLSVASCYCGNDSGVTHLAAVLGVPTVAVFGSTIPGCSRPLGPHAAILAGKAPCVPCMKRTCRYGTYECLLSVSVEDVVNALSGLEAFNRSQGKGR